MSTYQSETTNKLNIWHEILGYLYKVYGHLNLESEIPKEWCHLNTHQGVLRRSRDASKVSMESGRTYDQHGNTYKELLSWQLKDISSSGTKLMAVRDDVEDIWLLDDIRLEVAYVIREELTGLERDGRDVLAVEALSRRLAEIIDPVKRGLNMEKRFSGPVQD